MSSNTRQQVWKAIKPHLPLIKFKKGSNVKTSDTSVAAVSISKPAIGSTPRGTGIDEEFMPKRYERKPITAQEMEIIERGGAL